MNNDNAGTNANMVKYDKALLGPRLLAIRQKRAKTQKVFAERVGLHHTVYSHYERNYRTPTLQHLLDLANAWDFDLNEVLR